MDSGTSLSFWAIAICAGIILVFYVYHFLRGRGGSGRDYSPPVNVHQRGGAERRQHPRTDVHWAVSMETSDGTIDAEVKNISLGGAFICCKKPFPIGQVFSLTMTGPENEPVIATAEVVWSNANVPDEKVINRGMGVRFIKMSERHLQLVRQLFQKSD
jgi:uncharacterized protein (TIGR02266 family)